MNKNRTIKNFEDTISPKPKRSKFTMNHSLLTTMDAGELIPIYLKEIIPGDRWKINTKAVIRQTTMIKPVMDNAYIDITYFFVPMRLIWDDWKKFMGENNDPWASTGNELWVPEILNPEGGWETGTLADYFGVPVLKNTRLSALPFRAYALIWNEWFRDQNLQSAIHIDKSTSPTKTGSNGKNYITDTELGGYPAPTNKYHDYFTSALPSPQKGEPATISLLETAEVYAGPDTHNKSGSPLKFKSENNEQDYYTPILQKKSNNQYDLRGTTDKGGSVATKEFIPNNLYADLSAATKISINDLRKAITIQQMLELDARGGTRYTEILKSHFGVNSGDARQQRPEYLGGFKEPLGVQQVPQTSSSDNTSPQANLAAIGQTGISKSSVNKGFTEHGYIIGLATIRYHHTYQQGLSKTLSHTRRTQFYDPIFANLGEQPILQKEIYTSGNFQDDAKTFGFQEAWAEYRYETNKITGLMRSGIKGSLDIWHYGDEYSETPKLDDKWIQEDKSNIQRTLALKEIESEEEEKIPIHQFYANFYFENEADRPMPTYSIPGIHKI